MVLHDYKHFPLSTIETLRSGMKRLLKQDAVETPDADKKL